MDKLKEIFDSILCLCAEGVEFHARTELAELIIKEAQKGYEICNQAQQEDSAGNPCNCPAKETCPEYDGAGGCVICR